MYEKIKRIKQLINEGKANPYALDINPTYACNLRCRFCNGAQAGLNQKERDRVSDEKFLHIIKEAIDLGIKEFHIAGDGEPLVKKKLFLDIATVIKQNKLHGKVTTNGTLFDNKLIKRLVELEWDTINFSIEGSHQRIHDYLVCVDGAFKKCLKAISLFNNYKIKFKKKYPLMRITSVITNKNFYDLKNIIKLASELKIKHADFEPLAVCERKVKKLQLNSTQKKEFWGIVQKASRTAYNNFIYTNIHISEEINLKKQKKSIHKETERVRNNHVPVCFQPWYRMVVRPNGQVQPCCNFYDQSAENIARRSLKEIWYGNYFNSIRENILQHHLYEDCNRCNAWIILETKKIQAMLHSTNFLKNPFYHLSEIGNQYLPDIIKDFFYFKILKHA